MTVTLKEFWTDIIKTPPNKVIDKFILFMACSIIFIPVLEMSIDNTIIAITLSIFCNLCVYLINKDTKPSLL